MSAPADAPLRIALPGRIDLLALHARDPQRYPFLLESAAAHVSAARFDLLFAFPGESFSARHDAPDCRAFFERLDLESRRLSPAADETLPFTGGWFLYLGYEAARGVEPRLELLPSPHRLPDALAVRCTAAVIVDHAHDRTWLIAEDGNAQLEQLRADCQRIAAAPPMPDAASTQLVAIEEDDPQRFLDGVAEIGRRLRAGDTFQVNLSRAWRARLAPGSRTPDLYRALRRSNPAPFAGLMEWNGSSVLSSSPERLLTIESGIAQTRPIAGTHARAHEAGQDAAQRAHLLASLKERSEHIMLIDLERNDLGRVCEPGSVEVSELMALESYAHVHHIVSNVRGRLRHGTGPGTALRAVFPGGTITGCPKVRAMQIIAALEGTGRGAYTGALGYLSHGGRLDTNILIRTLVREDDRVSFRAGAGIVADSDAASELAESRAKARGLLLALGAATA